VVFGPRDDTVIAAGTRLKLYDFGVDGTTEISFPEAAFGETLFRLDFEFTDTGQLVLLGGDSVLPAVLAVFDGEVWTEGPTDLDEPLPIRTVFEFGDDGPALNGYDANGEVVWTNASIAPYSGEGFTSESAGAVTIVAGCFGETGGVDCDRHEVGGVDSATGDVLWQLPGNRGVGPVGDGYALVTDGEESGAWLLIDAATGELVDDTQQWDDPLLFSAGCCGDEFNWVALHGGIVIATHDKRVAVWYPKSAGLDPHSVSFG
jgi:hypothetical protein